MKNFCERLLLIREMLTVLNFQSIDWFLYDRDLRHERVKHILLMTFNSSGSFVEDMHFYARNFKHFVNLAKLWKFIPLRYVVWYDEIKNDNDFCNPVEITSKTIFWSTLKHIMPPVSFYIPWKHQKTKVFLMFSGGI